MRADELAAIAVRAALERGAPGAPRAVEDLMLGCGQPAGEQGYNIGPGRRAARRAATTCPGITVNRYCSSSLQTIRMAAHAIRAGEGDSSSPPASRACSRFDRAAPTACPSTNNPRFADAEARPQRAPRAAPHVDARPPVLPDVYIAMGQTAENVAEPRASPGRRWTSSPRGRSSAPVAARRTASSTARSFRSTLARRHRRSARTTGRGRHDRRELAELKPVFRPDGRVTAGNACPLNDGAAAVVVMSDTGRASSGITPLARIVVDRRVRPSTRRSWASGRSRRAAGARARRA